MQTLKDILDINYVRKHYNGDYLIKLKKGKKGVSVFANKAIRKGQLLAYYKFKVYARKHRTYKGGGYAMTVYTKNGNEKRQVIGDIYTGSLTEEKNGVPFWGYFFNEPSTGQERNAYLNENKSGNYKTRSSVKVGDTMIYKIVATKNIKKGEEITWCYGSVYDRGYKTSCK